MAVSTKNVAGRRKLHFESFDELSADLDQLAASPVRCLGNWSLGTICGHLAKSMNQSIDGAPFQAPWLIRTFAPLLKNRFLTKGLTPGFKMPASAAKVLIPNVADDAAGIAELRAAIARQQRETPRAASPVFGRMTPDEWKQLHFRHAELHLGFVVPV